MLTIRNRTQVVAAAVAITGVALVTSLVNVQIAFEPEVRDVIRWKIAVLTIVVAFVMGLYFMNQMLKNYRLSVELQRLVNRDRLTDVATRDFFFAQTSNHPNAYGVSLMIDIDNFKRVNDTYGHLVGDEVIRAVADVLRQQLRGPDIVCRFGGEEFVVFLRGADPHEAWTIAERIRNTIETVATVTSEGTVQVTVSVGGSLKLPMDDLATAIKRADACLYRAKAAGRNRTVVDWKDAKKPGHSVSHVAA